MYTIPAPLFPIEYHIAREQLIFENIIEDRGSRYTVSVYPLSHSDEWEIIRKGLDTSATHHSYAWRILQDDGSIIQNYDDDGETWAGQIILRELERSLVVDTMLVVTRYFGGIKLEADRYKHIVDGCRMALDRVVEFGL